MLAREPSPHVPPHRRPLALPMLHFFLHPVSSKSAFDKRFLLQRVYSRVMLSETKPKLVTAPRRGNTASCQHCVSACRLRHLWSSTARPGAGILNPEVEIQPMCCRLGAGSHIPPADSCMCKSSGIPPWAKLAAASMLHHCGLHAGWDRAEPGEQQGLCLPTAKDAEKGEEKKKTWLNKKAHRATKAPSFTGLANVISGGDACSAANMAPSPRGMATGLLLAALLPFPLASGVAL